MWVRVLIQASRIFVIGSKRSQTTLFIDARNKVLIPFYYSCYFVIYVRWDCISHPDHPACSIEALQKTVQWAARPFCIQQNTVSRARRMVPMLYHSRKNCNNNNMDFVNDFHIHTEVSSVEGGTTCTLPDKSVLGGKETDSMGLCLEYSLPPAVL